MSTTAASSIFPSESIKNISNLLHTKLKTNNQLLRTSTCYINQSLFRHFTALHWYSEENSICVSVCLSNVWIVAKRKKCLSRFLYHTKDHFPSFLRRRMVGGGGATRPTWNLGQPEPIVAKSPILNRYWLIVLQP